MTRCILFFNENPIPSNFTKGTLAAKELRLRAALPEIDIVHVICRRGHSIETENKERGGLEKKIHVHQVIPWPYYGAGFIFFFYGIYYILKYRPIILEAESGIISGPAVVLLGKIFGLPTLVELRATYEALIKVHALVMPLCLKQFLLKIVTTFSYSQATCLIANSKTYQRYLLKRGFESVVINPGLQYPPSMTSLKRNRQNIICFMGRLVDEKGVDDFLIALDKIKIHLLHAKWRVWVVGEGVKENQLKALTESLKLHDLVTFLGAQPNYKTLSQVKLLVNPCYVAVPLEMVNVEAAYSGVPVVCYGNKYLPETVVDGVTGIKVAYRNVSELALTIKKVVLDYSKYEKFGRSGYDFAIKNYSFEDQVAALKNVYTSLKLI